MITDAIIDEIREIRIKLTQENQNDAKKIIEHYIDYQSTFPNLIKDENLDEVLIKEKRPE